MKLILKLITDMRLKNGSYIEDKEAEDAAAGIIASFIIVCCIAAVAVALLFEHLIRHT